MEKKNSSSKVKGGKQRPKTYIKRLVRIDKNYFGETLKEVRKSKNLTQGDLASKLNITQAQWSAYEVGKSRPDLDMILTIADVLEISPVALICRSIDKSRFSNAIFELPIDKYEEIIEKTIEPLRTQVAQEQLLSLQKELKNNKPPLQKQ